MKDNLEIYNKYKAVPDNALKPFDNGRFKGTDINTMWRIKSLTEAFGMVGIGWYYTIKRLWIEETPNGEQFAFAEIELFVKVDGEWSKPISGSGGNKLARETKDGTLMTSDEAYKMAVTDAFGVACKLLGFGADVYWENDRTKYSESAQHEDKKAKTAQSKSEPASMTLEQAMKMKSSQGTLYSNLPDAQLKWIIENSKVDRYVEAAVLVLEDRQKKNRPTDELKPIEDDVPWI